nr:ABC transporter ATP-binding protein [Boudabousia tangfeifanii]
MSLTNVSAEVELGNGQILRTVDSVSLELEVGKSYALVGKSGSGKTSLASIVGLLNAAYTGRFIYQGTDVATLKDRNLSELRAESIGFVFQNYSLIRHLNVFENVELALMYLPDRPTPRIRKRLINHALMQVGLNARAHEFPGKLSGGEQQRVAIARALVTSPKLLICDEPTGALDTSTSTQVMAILHKLVSQMQTTLLLVTHDSELATTCDHTFVMSQGRIMHAADVMERS